MSGSVNGGNGLQWLASERSHRFVPISTAIGPAIFASTEKLPLRVTTFWELKKVTLRRRSGTSTVFEHGLKVSVTNRMLLAYKKLDSN